MQINLELPDELAGAILQSGEDPARETLEALGLEAYRQGRISGLQLRKLLGIQSRYELDGFLKEHGVFDYTVEDFDRDMSTLRSLRDKRSAEPQA